MSGAFLAGFVLGMFALAVVLVVVINTNQSAPPRAPTYEPPSTSVTRGGDA